MSGSPKSPQRTRVTSRVTQANLQTTPTKIHPETARTGSPHPSRPPSWDNHPSIAKQTPPHQARQTEAPAVQPLDMQQQHVAHHQQPQMQNFNGPAHAPPPYGLQAQAVKDTSPVKRPPARVPAPSYREEAQEPEIWELTRELHGELAADYRDRAKSSEPLSLSASLFDRKGVLDRTRQTVSYDSTRREPPRLAEVQPLRTAVNQGQDRKQQAQRPDQTLPSPVSSLQTQKNASPQAIRPPQAVDTRPLPLPPGLPAPPGLSAPPGLVPMQGPAMNNYSDSQETMISKTTATYQTALTTPATTSVAMTTTSGASPPFAFDDRHDGQTQTRVSSAENNERPRGTPERDTRPVDDRDEADDDRLPEASNGWHVVNDVQRNHETRHSPAESSLLIPTDEEDEQDLDYVNTPRSPPAVLPGNSSDPRTHRQYPYMQSPPAQIGGFNHMSNFGHISQLLMALQAGHVPSHLPAPIPTYPGMEYDRDETSPSRFDLYPSREPSVAAPPSISASINAFLNRPSAPIPPTPHYQTNAPTPVIHPVQSFSESTASSPYPGPLNPFLPFRVPQSLESSPSHVPIQLGGSGRRESFPRRPDGRIYARPPPSESSETAEPQDTESEGGENEDDLWVDEPSDDDLDQEFHPTFIQNPKRRRQKFEQKWRSLVKTFRDLDNSADATMLLIASTPDQRHTHLVISRAVLRHPTYLAYAHSAQQAFSFVAEARRRERADRARTRWRDERNRSLSGDEMSTAAAYDQLVNLDVNSVNGEENLKSALDYAITSLKELHTIYELRDQRRREEDERQRKEQMSIQSLLQMLSGTSVGGSSS